MTVNRRPRPQRNVLSGGHSTVTDLARLRGLSTSQPALDRDVVAEQLDRDRGDDREGRPRGSRGSGSARRRGPAGSSAPSVAMAMIGPLRALISCMLETILLKTSPLGARNTLGHFSLMSAIGPVLHLGGRIPLGVDVGDLLQLERPLEGDREEGQPPEEEEVACAGRSAWRSP